MGELSIYVVKGITVATGYRNACFLRREGSGQELRTLIVRDPPSLYT